MTQILINIPALFRAVTEEVGVILGKEIYFDCGKLKEVTRRLTEKDGGIASKNRKYPLVWLVMNYAETYGDTGEYCELNDITLMFCNLTEPHLSTADRLTRYFEPVLYPLYAAFMQRLNDCGYFDFTGEVGFAHRKIDCPLWNEDMQGGKENQFNDYIDAIQVRNLNLTVNETTCDRFQLLGAAAGA